MLFVGAAKLQVTELGKRWLVPALMVGPGAGLMIVVGALAYHQRFGGSGQDIGIEVLDYGVISRGQCYVNMNEERTWVQLEHGPEHQGVDYGVFY